MTRNHRAMATEDTTPVVETLAEAEKRLILRALHLFGGHRERTAKALGIGVRTLSEKLRGYDLPPRWKPTNPTA